MKLTPIECRTSNQLAKLSHNNVLVGQFSIMVDCDTGKVYLSEHPTGGNQVQHIEIPRLVFNKLARWYVNGKVPREDAASRRAQ